MTTGSTSPDLPTAAPEPADSASPPMVEPLRCSAVLTHHWLVRQRGGEKVLRALCELLPGSPVYTLVHDSVGAGDGWPAVHTSFLQKIPGARRNYPKLLPLMPLAARRMKLPSVDLVVCSDAAIAKAMTPDPRSKVVCYCHSPMRYAFEEEIARDYGRTLPFPLRPFWNPLRSYLRSADQRAAQRVDLFIANSQNVAARIKRAYGRESVVIYPPVDLPAAPATAPRESFYLCVGHHVSYKRLDLAIAACRKLGRRLVVIGDGPDVERLRRLRERDSQQNLHVTLLGWQPDSAVQDHYRRAAALIFPGEEDFGIVPVEAMAHGCPVIAFAAGGARETVVPDQTGVWFEQQTVEALAEAIQRCERRKFDPQILHGHARQFGRERFLRQMGEILARILK